MRHSEGRMWPSNKSTNASPPNLTVMVHFYSDVAHLFRSVTMYSDVEREGVFDEIVTSKSWYWGRYAPGHRQGYMRARLFVEHRMREAFSRKYWPPKSPSPVFFYLYPRLSLPVIEEKLHERERLGEPHTKFLLVDLVQLPDTAHVSFTMCDSHTSYREELIRQGLSEQQPNAALADHGTVFHIGEIREVYERHRDEENLYFEVQVWDPEMLDEWRRSHDI